MNEQIRTPELVEPSIEATATVIEIAVDPGTYEVFNTDGDPLDIGYSEEA